MADLVLSFSSDGARLFCLVKLTDKEIGRLYYHRASGLVHWSSDDGVREVVDTSRMELLAALVEVNLNSHLGPLAAILYTPLLTAEFERVLRHFKKAAGRRGSHKLSESEFRRKFWLTFTVAGELSLA